MKAHFSVIRDGLSAGFSARVPARSEGASVRLDPDRCAPSSHVPLALAARSYTAARRGHPASSSCSRQAGGHACTHQWGEGQELEERRGGLESFNPWGKSCKLNMSLGGGQLLISIIVTVSSECARLSDRDAAFCSKEQILCSPCFARHLAEGAVEGYMRGEVFSIRSFGS